MARKCSTRYGCSTPRANWWNQTIGTDWFNRGSSEAINTIAPSISPTTAGIGDIITVTPGTWSGSPTLTYQWQRDGVDISGETGTTYNTTIDDDGADITVVEIPNGDTGSGIDSNACAVALDTEYQAILTYAASNALTPAPSGNDLVLQQYLKRYLDAIGVWDGADTIHVYDKGSSGFARINWKNPGTFTDTLAGTTPPTWVEHQGFDGSGNGYLDDNWIPSTNGVNFTQNDAGVIVYTPDNAAVNGRLFGCSASVTPTNQTTLNPRSVAGNLTIGVNAGTTLASTTQASSNGTWHIKRTASGQQAHQNGVLRLNNTDAVANRAGVKMVKLANNAAGTINSFDTRTLTLIIRGASFDGQEMEIHTGINAYVSNDIDFFRNYFND